jgi:NADH-ubiquinone oxidoreductase chain 3
MTATTFFLVLIPILGIVLLIVNVILSPENTYVEKDSAFECGFHSFVDQNRVQFDISFFIFGLLFLLFDLEILLLYPYVVSAFTNGIYGLVIALVFSLVLTLGFTFELGKNALKLQNKQNVKKQNLKPWSFYTLTYK